ncbi:MAG: hypothetical protein KIT31_19530 [Deltaproteobacteria bacterium]|nr:hypothetical protein [Deltaproteobacteria bacterium]
MTGDVEALFARLEDDPDDDAAYLVLADALQLAGDPRGELIQLSHDLAPGRGPDRDRLAHWSAGNRQRQLMSADRARILGGFDDDRTTLTYKLGFADTAIVRGDATAPTFATLLRAPESRLLRTALLRLGEGDFLARDALAAVGPVPRALRRVALERQAHARPLHDPSLPAFTHRRYAQWTAPARGRRPERRPTLDDVSRVLDVFPHIRELLVDLGLTSLEWAPLRSTELRRFTWITPYADPREVAPLAASQLPALESFILWVGARHVARDFRPDDSHTLTFDRALGPSDLAPVFAMLDGCRDLRELGLCNIERDFGRIASALVQHRFLERIEALDVSACDLRDEANTLHALLRELPRLAHICIAGTTLPGAAVTALVARYAVVGEPVTQWQGTHERYRQIHEPW